MSKPTGRVYVWQGGPSPKTGKTVRVVENAQVTVGTCLVFAHPAEVWAAQAFFTMLALTTPAVVRPHPLQPRATLDMHVHPTDYDAVVTEFESPDTEPEAPSPLTPPTAPDITATALPYDPKLKDAMEEIKEILRRYDLGASIHLVSPTHSEYRYQFPTWSCAQHEQTATGWGVRVRAKKEDFPDREAQHHALEITVHLLCQLRDLGRQDSAVMEHVLKLLDPFMEVTHHPFAGHKPHGED